MKNGLVEEKMLQGIRTLQSIKKLKKKYINEYKYLIPQNK